jgi:glycosyltransferase involved in cell wall biosynthesis
VSRVLVLNAYPLDWRLQEVDAGLRPDQELYGVNYFAKRGYEIELMPHEHRRVLRRLGALLGHRHFPLPLGDVRQQAAAWRRAAEADIVYAASQPEALALGYLRAAGLLRVPLVVVAHHPPAYYRGAALQRPLLRRSLGGCDAVVCLNDATARAVNALAPRAPYARAKAIPWGPDARFFTPAAALGDLFVSAGQAGRDFGTFATAAAQAGVEAYIVTHTTTAPPGAPGGDDPQPGVSQHSEGVTLELRRTDDWMSHVDLRDLYRRARAVAIPLERTAYLAGLTSLVDALAMGLPIVMTRTPFIDLDLEAQGVGIWVEPGDVAGWRAALERLRDHPREATEMGARARALVDDGFDSRHFAHEITAVFDRLLAPSRSQP